MKLATEIAACGPLAVQDTKATMRVDLAEQVRAANKHEQALQVVQMATEDFREGVTASHERRAPNFTGN